MKVGWVGNYARGGKQFGLAFDVCRKHGHEFCPAGGLDSGLYIPHDEMPDYYRGLDCLLVTSVFEAHPLAVYEALACGCPVVINRNTGDCHRNSVYGIVYYDMWVPELIGEALTMAEDNLDNLSNAGVKCINKNWTWEKHAPSYIHMFKELAPDVDEPLVGWVLGQRDWAWDFMYKEISKYVWSRIVPIYVGGKQPSWFSRQDFDEYDIIINNPWQMITFTDDEVYPADKHVVAVNGPAFINPSHMKAYWNNLSNCKALTTVSLNIMDLLRFTGKTIYYASRGVDTAKFNPG